MAKKNRILLINGCSMSTPSVYPSNWKEGGAELLEIDWRIQYYYYDPEQVERWPRGKLCVVKGMNEFKTLEERRFITQQILKDDLENIKSGWNPITKTQMVDSSIDAGTFHPDLPFIDAFRLSLGKLQCTEKHRYEVGRFVGKLEKAAIKLRMRNITIDNLKRRDLKHMMHAMNLPAKSFNHARGYISSLFPELIEEDCCDVNLARDIRPMKTTVQDREILSDEEYDAVMEYLRNTNYTFYRYSRIFMFSGCRSSELISLQMKDVNLRHHEFTVTIKKGNKYKRVTKVILGQVDELWKEACKEAGPNDYIFSRGLVPGPDKIRDDQITIRWRKNVKRSKKIHDSEGNLLTITADFYSLKHKMLDMLDEETAMKLASHTNLKTTNIYRVNKEKRDREELKKLRVVV